MFPLALVFLFIIKLRFPPHRSLTSIILERYDYEGLKCLRYFEKTDYKLRKISCDLEFLLCCKTNDLCPNFLQPKLYSKDIYNEREYNKFQQQLLDREVQIKRETKVGLQRDFEISLDNLKEGLSYLDFKHACNIIFNGNDHQIRAVKVTHDKKLFKLGLSRKFEVIKPDDVIFNL